MTEWEEDCLHWRGRVLTGKYKHWCLDWDDLPIDETCHEWPCACADELRRQAKDRLKERYGIELTQKEWSVLKGNLLQGRGVLTKLDRETGQETRLITVKGQLVPFLVHPGIREIITCLPKKGTKSERKTVNARDRRNARRLASRSPQLPTSP